MARDIERLPEDALNKLLRRDRAEWSAEVRDYLRSLITVS